MIYKYLTSSLLTILFLSCQAQTDKKENSNTDYNVIKSEKEWKKQLTEQEYYVLREKGTERAFSDKYNDHHEEGVYLCAACKNEVFASSSKYDSKSGWPSFYEPYSTDNVEVKKDYSLGMVRDEVLCGSCGSHLGHVFNDGPKPTGLRYCVNSIALDFKEKE